MKSFILGLSLIFISEQQRKYTASPQVITQVLPQKFINLAQNQEFVYYFDNPHVYNVDVFYIQDGKESLVQDPSIKHNGQEQDDGLYEGRSECYPKKRQLILDDVLTLTVFNETDQMSDILVIAKHNASYIISENLILQEVRFMYEENQIINAQLSLTQYSDLKSTLNKNIEPTKAKFAYVEGSMYPVVFTQHGVVLLKIDEKEIVEIIGQVETPSRSTINDVHQINEIIYVAVGHQGIDIYHHNGQHVYHVMNINETQINQQIDINIIDVTSDHTNKYLIALDSNNGLYFFDLDDVQKVLFNIYFPRIRAFNHYNNTFIVIAETVNGIEYVTEIFVDILKKEYYFNRIYVEDTSFYHIEMTPFYAILVSEDNHIVIQHSIYDDFIPKSFQIVSSFEEEDLIKLVHFHPKVSQNKNQVDYYIGMAKTDIKVFQVTHQPSGVVCQFEFYYFHKFISKLRAYQYRVALGASTCFLSDTSNYNVSNYQQCQINQTFNVNVDRVLFESNQLTNIVVATSIVILFLIVLAITAYLFYKKWGKQIVDAKRRVTELKKYKPLAELGPILQLNNEGDQQTDPQLNLQPDLEIALSPDYKPDEQSFSSPDYKPADSKEIDL